jgi:hypothetical protein
MRTQDADGGDRQRRIAAYIQANGAVARGTGLVVTKGAAGTYTVRPQGLRVLVALAATLHGNQGFIWALGANAPPTATVTTYNAAGALTDLDFSLTLTGTAA